MSKILRNNAPLFEYLEAKQNEEFSTNFIKNCKTNIRNNYLLNSVAAIILTLSICFTFYVQFKVDMMQNKITAAHSKIAAYEKDLKLLDIEWTYLTRPDRVRKLSKKYLKNNQIINYSQVKNFSDMRQFYLVNLKKRQEENILSSLD